METVCLLVSAVGTVMAGWAATLTWWGYGPKPATVDAPETPRISGAPSTPDMLDVPAVNGGGVVINAENVIINSSVFMTDNPNDDEPPACDANPAEDPAHDESR